MMVYKSKLSFGSKRAPDISTMIAMSNNCIATGTQKAKSFISGLVAEWTYNQPAVPLLSPHTLLRHPLLVQYTARRGLDNND